MSGYMFAWKQMNRYVKENERTRRDIRFIAPCCADFRG